MMRFALRWWAPFAFSVGAAVAITSLGSANAGTWGTPGLAFAVVVVPSGAGHDAQHMARLCPSGMIFVPSVGGVSHAPKEFTRAPDVVNGANVLLQAMLALDTAAWT